jgi:taurine--2-oxoglutarate transaminase
LELVRDKATREPLVPFEATGPANAPMAALAGACKRRGLLPFVNGSRTHVVPALNVTDDEARYGLALLEEALDEVAAGL